VIPITKYQIIDKGGIVCIYHFSLKIQSSPGSESIRFISYTFITKAGVVLKISPLITRSYHVDLFQNFMKEIENEGHEVMAFSLKDNLTKSLIETFKIKNDYYGVHSEKFFYKAISPLYHRISLLQGLNRFDPDLILSVNSLPLAPFTYLFDAPSVVFLDKQLGKKEEHLVFNYSDKIVTPDCYHYDVPKGKHLTHSSYHTLAYLHPNRFTPDDRVLEKLDVDQKEYVVVSFEEKPHLEMDLKEEPLRRRQMIDLVRFLDDHSRVFLDERGLVPEPLEKYIPSIPPRQYLDLIANARLVIGNEPITSSEAGVLGVPWIYVSGSTTYSLEDQELRYEIGSQVYNVEEAEELAEMILTGEVEPDFELSRKHILKDKTDLTNWMLTLVKVFKKFGYLK